MIGRVLIAALQGYRRFVSPLMMPHCRFQPSCSEYAIVALREHGVPRGLWLTLQRLGKCQPFHAGGVDPVPSRRSPRGTVPASGASQ